MEEIFVPVKGYEGLYEVSNMGKVKILEKTYYSGMDYHIKRVQQSKIKSTTVARNGYENVHIQKDKKTQVVLVHRLVWAHFGDRECPAGMQIDHINGNKTDNRIENLQILSAKENRRKSIKRDLPIGVVKHYNKFQSQITKNGKGHFLGLFDTPEEAHNKYLWAEQNL